MQRKKLLSICLIILLIIGLAVFNTKVFANENNSGKSEGLEENTENYSRAYLEYLKLSDEEKAKIDVIPRKYDVPFDALYEEKEEKNIIKKAVSKLKSIVGANESEVLPASFILRGKDTNNDGIVNDKDIKVESYGGINIPVKNQSEYGLCWAFASIRSLETNLALHGYGNYDFSEMHLAYIEKNGFANKIDEESGGYFYEFNDYTQYNYGPVFEEEAPYRNYEEKEYDQIYNIESKAYEVKTIDFPTIDKQYETYTDEALELFRSKVKRHIMKNGSVYISIDSDSIKYTNGFNTIYNTTTMTNHAISVIGWDDNFSREYFRDENNNMPEKNGAYIALNSWGEHSEIIYISYEDTTVERDMSGVISATTKKNDAIKTIKLEDRNLYKALIEELDKCIIERNDETLEIKCVNIDCITFLELDGQEIYNINGIDEFKNLESINLSNNNITDVSALWNMKNLEYINLSRNKIENLNNVSEMPNLNNLYLAENNIKNINGIECIENLKSINLDSNELTNVDILENLKKLQYIGISNNKIHNIDFINNLDNLYGIDITYNNIEDISSIKLFQEDRFLDLSGNPIKYGLDEFNNVSEIHLNDCNLNNDSIDILASLTNLKSISLKNNNLTDVSKLKNLELNSLDLSGNKNIDLNTVPLEGTRYSYYEIEEDEEKTHFNYCLYLDDCNITDIKVLKNFKGNTLYLNNNPITDITPLTNIEIYSVSLRNTNIQDVSSLNKITILNLSGNNNLIGIDKLQYTIYLTLNNCNINDITSLSNLINLELLYLDYNNIIDITPITNLNKLRSLSITNNIIEVVPDFSNCKNLDSIDLSNNQIKNIDGLEQLIERGCFISVVNNKISEIGDNVDKFIDRFNNQLCDIDIDIAVNKDNIVEFPTLLKRAYSSRFENNFPIRAAYKNQTKFLTKNCVLDYENKQIIFHPTKLGVGIATIEVTGGIYDGTVYTFNYNSKEELNLEKIESKNLPNKFIYTEGENYELGEAVIYEVYEGGVKQETSDFSIVNGVNLSAGQKYVTIRSNKNPELEIKVDISVYAKDAIERVNFPDNDLYGTIKYIVTSENPELILECNDDTNILTMKKEEMDKVTRIIMAADERVNDLSGLEHFTNLHEIQLSKYNSEIIYGKEKLELPKCIYQLLTLWKGKCAEATIYYDTYYYDIDTTKYPYINYKGNKKVVDIEIDYENEKAFVTLDNETEKTESLYNSQKSIVRGGYAGEPIKLDNIRGIEIKITGNIIGPSYTGFYKICNHLWNEGEIILEPTCLEKGKKVYTCTECGAIKEEEIPALGHEYNNDKCIRCDEKIFIENSKYVINETSLTGINPNTAISEFLNNIRTRFEASIMRNSETITEGKIGTGMKVQIKENENVIGIYFAIVTGDCNGDGEANIKDMVKINNYRLYGTTTNFDEIYQEAADVNKDGKIDIKDMVRINNYRLYGTDF